MSTSSSAIPFNTEEVPHIHYARRHEDFLLGNRGYKPSTPLDLVLPYLDKDGLRKEEVAALSGPNELAEFYNRLKQIKEFHKKHPNELSSKQ
ncbi:Splicing factor 3A subunit 3 [Portunus trituberculatus]|uniref:Splicing factor 3A subunit 3 n=1 Tax=Portunus trituberculatus TaxID=210409 RepID=A0A5B7F262_PORTR|nr:Splicing factor 3A subunit 3 [Portunus trituberculatus]